MIQKINFPTRIAQMIAVTYNTRPFLPALVMWVDQKGKVRATDKMFPTVRHGSH